MLIYLPDNRIFKTRKFALTMLLKRMILRKKGVVIRGNTVFSGVSFLGSAVIEPYCRMLGDPKITVGNNFYMNAGCHILGNINIGNDVMIGPKTVIWGRDHGMERGRPMRVQPHKKEDVIIGDDVWISANVTILKGVKIGSGTVS